MSDKRCTEEDVVAQLSDGMTIAIGGWGSRRKPMSMVRAIARSNLKDLTIVSYGGPDVGLLCATGQATKVVYAFVSLDTIPLEPHFRAARQSGAVQDEPYDEGLFLLGLQAAAWRVPFLPSRVGLGSDLFRDNPSFTTVEFDGEQLVAVKAFELDAALVHMNRADERGNGQFLGPDLYFDDLMVQAAPTGRRFMSVERIVDTNDLAKEGTHHTRRISRMSIDGVIEAPNGAHFTSCDPDYKRDELFQKEYAASAKTPEAFAEFKTNWIDLTEAEYQAKLRAAQGERTRSYAWSDKETKIIEAPTRADVCAVAVADTFRGDGEILCNPIGTIPMIGGRLARASFEPDLCMTDGEAALIANDESWELPDDAKIYEYWNPYRSMFDWVWSGRRHVMMGATQVDQYGNQNIAAIGDYAKPRTQLLGYRGAPGNTINDTTSYWVPNHSPQVICEHVDTVCGIGYDRAAQLPGDSARFHEIRRVVTNLCVLDFETPDHRMRLRSVHPGVSVEEVVAATGFELVIPDNVPESRLPTDEEMVLLYARIDPQGRREEEVPNP